MASFSDILNAVDKTISELESKRHEAALGMTLNLIAAIELRVIERGERADGGQFSGYSEAVVPYWYQGSSLKNAAFNVENRQKQLLKKKGYFASYKDWREINSRRTDIKNFSFTGMMWESIQPFVTIDSEGVSEFEIRSSDSKMNNTVIPAHSNREGINILQASESELDAVRQAYLSFIEKIMNNNGLTT